MHLAPNQSHVERIPVRPPKHSGDDVRADPPPQDTLEESPDLPSTQTLESGAVEGVVTRQVAQAAMQRMPLPHLGVAIGAEHQHGRLTKLVRRELEQQKRGLIGPVQVVQDEKQRRAEIGSAMEGAAAVRQDAARDAVPFPLG